MKSKMKKRGLRMKEERRKRETEIMLTWQVESSSLDPSQLS